MIKNIKKIIWFLCNMAFCTAIALGAPQIAGAEETETFTGASGKSGDLKWNITPEGHLTVIGEGDYEPVSINFLHSSNTMAPEWLQYRTYIRTARIDVKGITSARYMFRDCNNLTNLDLSNFDTSNVTDMIIMFGYCNNLTNLDLSNFNTSNVTDMTNMFKDCNNLTNLDLSNFDTRSVTDMHGMFNGCNNLTNLNLNNFDTRSVTNISSMFHSCSGLIDLDLSNFNTSSVTDMSSTFAYCYNLKSLNLKNFNTSNVINMRNMFSECNSLKSLDLSSFNTNNVTSMVSMFNGCNNLTNLDLSNFDTSSVTSMHGMFSECNNLNNLDLSSFNTSNVINMPYMFSGCNSLNSLDLSSFNTSNVTNMPAMFCNCKSLRNLDLSNFNTSNVTDMNAMFAECNNLNSLDLSSFNTSSVTNMAGMFYNCNSLNNLDLSNFNTSSAISMANMFNNCNSLSSLDISNFDTNNIINTDNITLSHQFLLSTLRSLEKLYFFANALYEYELPLSINYCWINEDNETCTKTAKLDRKMTYTRVDKDYVPPIIPTPIPSLSPVVPSDAHIFSDYNYSNPVTDNEAVIYGNGANLTIDGQKVNNKVFTAYTDILASYKYTLNSKGIVKPSIGKVIVGVTKSDAKPEVNSKNKITDTSASKIAKAKIKNGQITVTAVGKESGLVYLWVIDTGSKGVSACCPIDVKLAPTKLEVQNTSGSKLTKNTKLENGKTLDVCVAGLVGSAKTEDCTYTATVDLKYQSYITVTPVQGSTNKFTINAKGLKNNKDTKVTITFKCDQNGKKTNLSLTISN